MNMYELLSLLAIQKLLLNWHMIFELLASAFLCKVRGSRHSHPIKTKERWKKLSIKISLKSSKNKDHRANCHPKLHPKWRSKLPPPRVTARSHLHRAEATEAINCWEPVNSDFDESRGIVGRPVLEWEIPSGGRFGGTPTFVYPTFRNPIRSPCLWLGEGKGPHCKTLLERSR